MHILYEKEDGNIFLKVFEEKLNMPFYLNGDSYNNSYRMICKRKVFKKNYESLGLTKDFIDKKQIKTY